MSELPPGENRAAFAHPNPEQLGWEQATHWSVVLKAGATPSPEASEALQKLCRTYWHPVYVFIRQRGYEASQAEDLAQSFFAHFLGKRILTTVDQAKGKFRSFLLISLKNFLSNEWDRAHRQKRGGQAHMVSLDDPVYGALYERELTPTPGPDKAYDRQWALALLQQTLKRLEAEHAAAGKAAVFERLSAFLTDTSGERYADVGADLGMSRDAVAMSVHRLRERFRKLLLEEIALTVSHSGQAEDELSCLMAALRGQ